MFMTLLPVLLQLGWYILKWFLDDGAAAKAAGDKQYKITMDNFWKAVEDAKVKMLAQAKQDSDQAKDVEDQIDKDKKTP